MLDQSRRLWADAVKMTYQQSRTRVFNTYRLVGSFLNVFEVVVALLSQIKFILSYHMQGFHMTSVMDETDETKLVACNRRSETGFL